MGSRLSGTLFIKVDGDAYDVVGEFTYDIGSPKREALVGGDKVHGFKETPKVPYVEGEFRDRGTLSLKKLFAIDDATVTLQLANGKIILIRNAWYAGDGTVGSENANIKVRFEGLSGEEVRA